MAIYRRVDGTLHWDETEFWYAMKDFAEQKIILSLEQSHELQRIAGSKLFNVNPDSIDCTPHVINTNSEGQSGKRRR